MYIRAERWTHGNAFFKGVLGKERIKHFKNGKNLKKPGSKGFFLAENARIGLKSAPMKESALNIPPDIAALNFEDALAELEKLVRQLEDGKAKLEDAVRLYERGALLKKHCEAKLREAQAKIEQITVGSDGAVSTKDFQT